MVGVSQHGRLPFEVFVIDGLYTDEALDAWESYIKSSHGDRCFTNSGFKNGKVVLPSVSKAMWDAVGPHLPDEYVDGRGMRWGFDRASKYVMYAQVSAGQAFPLHTDTGSEMCATQESKFTVLTYLNADFEGGSTCFYDDAFIRTAEVHPKRGRTLVFDIDLFHEGRPVLSGEKLWIGTELVCGRFSAAAWAGQSCAHRDVQGPT
jgi:hypothetical protein